MSVKLMVLLRNLTLAVPSIFSYFLVFNRVRESLLRRDGRWNSGTISPEVR
jgi:hypothetical protein